MSAGLNRSWSSLSHSTLVAASISSVMAIYTLFEMTLGALILVAMFASGACSGVADTGADAMKVLSHIESNFKIDETSPPYLDSEKYWEGTCVQNWGKCPNLGKYRRNWLANGTATVYYKASLEESAINTDSNITQKLVLSKSTSITESRTQGWTIGGKISGTVGEDGNSVGAEISASYSDTSTTGRTDTRQVSYEMWCKPRHECRIETWTFHVKVTGFCHWKPMLDCAGQHDQCASPIGGCAQFNDVYHDNCFVKRPAHSCEVQTPLYEESGEPFAQIVWISVPMDAGPKRSELELIPEYRIIG